MSKSPVIAGPYKRIIGTPLSSEHRTREGPQSFPGYIHIFETPSLSRAFNGQKDENGKTIDRGLIGIRGQAAAEKIMETVRSCWKSRDAMKS
jgi:hypothetical protein